MTMLPRSLAAQLIGLLLLGIIAAHLIAIPLSGMGNGALHPIARDQALERAATAYRAVLACGDCDADRLLAAHEGRDARYRLTTAARPAAAAMSTTEAQLAAALGSRLGLTPEEGLQLRLVDAAATDIAPPPTVRAEATRLDIAIRLPDGRWLTAHLWPVQRTNWWRPLYTSVPVSVLPVLIIAGLFARRILRPARALASAAERVSRGERIDPLPVSGPTELREVTAAFNLMQHRLSRFIADRTAMLAAISHDFRTPITSLRLRVELLEDEAQREPMRRMLDEMRDMIDETLRFARDDSVREPTRREDLAGLVARVSEERRTLGHEVSCSTNGPLPYRCRPLALKRALGNLVDNAVRYGSRTQVTLHAQEAGDTGASQLRITVEDNGPGIPDDWLERVFEPFARPQPERARDNGGSGLGLAIARSCIAAHGGEIQLANRPEGGLRATILLPA